MRSFFLFATAVGFFFSSSLSAQAPAVSAVSQRAGVIQNFGGQYCITPSAPASLTTVPGVTPAAFVGPQGRVTVVYSYRYADGMQSLVSAPATIEVPRPASTAVAVNPPAAVPGVTGFTAWFAVWNQGQQSGWSANMAPSMDARVVSTAAVSQGTPPLACSSLRGAGSDAAAAGDVSVVEVPSLGETGYDSAAPTANFGMPNGNFVLQSINPVQGRSWSMQSLFSRRPDGSPREQAGGSANTTPYVWGVTQTYGSNHYTFDRDNMNAYNFTAKLAGGQLGSLHLMYADNLGDGDVVGTNKLLLGRGLNVGDQEMTEDYRGIVGTELDFFSAKLVGAKNCGTPVCLDRGNMIYTMANDMVRPGLARLGTNGYLINATHGYDTGNVEQVGMRSEPLPASDGSGNLSYTVVPVTGDAAAGWAQRFGNSKIVEIVFASDVSTVPGTWPMPAPREVTGTVKSSAQFATYVNSGKMPCNLSDKDDFEIVPIVAIPDATHITVATRMGHFAKSVLSCGGAANEYIHMTADEFDSQSFKEAIGNTAHGQMETKAFRGRPIVGSANGTLYTWAALTADYDTNALSRNHVAAPITVSLVTKNGAVVSGTVEGQKGNEFLNGGRTRALLPTPSIAVSAPCTASLRVDFYQREGSMQAGGAPQHTQPVMLGSPGVTKGAAYTPASNAVQVLAGGTGCSDATKAALQTTFENHYVISPLAIVPVVPYEQIGKTYRVQYANVPVELADPAEWAANDSILGVAPTHTGTRVSDGMFYYNAFDAGGNKQGFWANTYLSNLSPDDSGFFLTNATFPKQYVQANLPATDGWQGKRYAPNFGIKLSGAWRNPLSLPIPAQSYPGAISSAITLTGEGYAAPANLPGMFTLLNVLGSNGAQQTYYDRTVGALVPPVSSAQLSINLPQYAGNDSKLSPMLRSGSMFYNTTTSHGRLCAAAGDASSCSDLAYMDDTAKMTPTFNAYNSNATLEVTSYFNHAECNGAITLTLPAKAMKGMQIDIVNTNANATCTLAYGGGIGNATTAPTYRLAPGAAVRLAYNGSVFRVE